MCVVIYSPAGVNAPAKKELKQAWRVNPDGAGYMYVNDGDVVIRKGFLTFSDFWRHYQSDRATLKAAPVVIHLRIATHGGVSSAMCQPFPLSADTATLQRLDLRAPVGIAHNGIIAMTSYASKISDTAEYIARYMYPLYYSNVDRALALDLIEASINNSRLAIMSADGDVQLLGDWRKHDGCYYSNLNHIDTYKPQVSRYRPYSYSNVYNSCDYDCYNCDNQYNCYGYDAFDFSDFAEWTINDDSGAIDARA